MYATPALNARPLPGRKMHAGVLRFVLDDAPHTEAVLTAGQQVVIEPGVRHHVAFELTGRFQITFCRAAEA